jgi:AcrR family transcriptional regulator
MSTRQRWLDAGLRALTVQGATGITVDRLAARTKLTKGSFYHHFDGMPGYVAALMGSFEAEHTARFIAAAEADPAAPPSAKLARLLDLVLREYPSKRRPDVEVAIRAWAQQDAVVRAALERVDRIRVRYLRDLWLAQSGDRAEAESMGMLLYVMLIGAGYVLPPLTALRLARLYALVLPPVRQASAVAGPQARRDAR